MILAIEKAATQLQQSGRSDAWFLDAHDEVRKVSANVNGQLLHDLAAAESYVDMAAVDLFREGLLRLIRES